MSESESDTSVEGEALEGGIDLDALDAPGGMDAVLADYRAASAPKPKSRPLWVSAVAIALGLGLMVMMWPDFRYWLESEPRDAGPIAAAVTSGDLADLENRFVHLEGTPDVTHIVPIKRESGKRFGFMRLLEGEDQVFVFAPRKPEQRSTEFDRAYEGRLMRAGSLDSFDFLREAFALEDVRDEYELEPAQLKAWSAAPGGALNSREGAALTVVESDRISLRLRPKLLLLQLGRRHFKNKAAAEAAVASLGLPYVWSAPTSTKHDDPDAELPNHRPFHSYLVSAPAEQAGAIEDKLNEGLDLGDGTDPARGVVALPRLLSYTVAPDKLAVEGDSLVFEYGENTADLGHAVQGGKLVPRELDGPALKVPFAELELARLRRVVRLSSDAAVLVAEERPVHSRSNALLFMLVGFIVVINGGATYASARRREA